MAFCECGCGENAKNRFVNGHNKNRLGRNKYNDAGCSRVSNARIGKGNSNWRGGISKRLDSGVVRFCECGCGQRVKSWQRFVSGHNLRVPETVLKMKLRVAEAHRTFEARERARKRFVEDNPRKRPEAREAMRGENNMAKRLEVREKIMNTKHAKQATRYFAQGEAAAYEYLCGLGLEVKHLYPIGNYHADIFVAPNIVVEIDGSSHRGRASERRDRAKDDALHERGYCVFRINAKKVEIDPEVSLAPVVQEVR